jgi:DNA-binding NarL/FixJ family response regulator
MHAIRVLLVDDQVPFRKGVADLLAAERDFELVGEAGDGAEALELARELLPDVVLMDLSMPRMDGLEATRRIGAELPCARVVFLTVSDSERSLGESVKSGAHAYLPKSVAPQALLDTVRRVARGEAPFSQEMAARVLEELARDASLAAREREVLGRVAQGRSDEEVAADLNLSESIVKNTLKNILERLHREHRLQSAGPAVARD